MYICFQIIVVKKYFDPSFVLKEKLSSNKLNFKSLLKVQPPALNRLESNIKDVNQNILDQSKTEITVTVKSNNITSILIKCPKTPPNLQVQ